MLQNAKEDLRSATFWHLCNLMQHTAANMETWIMLNGMDLTIYYGRIWICQETKTQSDFNVLSVSFTDANILEQPDKTTRSVWCSKYLFFVGRHQLRLNITCIIFLSNYSKYIQSLCCESVLHIVHEVKKKNVNSTECVARVTHSPVTVFLQQQKQASAARRSSRSRGMPMPRTRPRTRSSSTSPPLPRPGTGQSMLM